MWSGLCSSLSVQSSPISASPHLPALNQIGPSRHKSQLSASGKSQNSCETAADGDGLAKEGLHLHVKEGNACIGSAYVEDLPLNVLLDGQHNHGPTEHRPPAEASHQTSQCRFFSAHDQMCSELTTSGGPKDLSLRTQRHK